MIGATPRVLIFSADIGAGHDRPAAVLADGIRRAAPGAEIEIVDGISAAGGLVSALVRNGQETRLQRLPWLFDLQYRLISSIAITRRIASAIGVALARRGIQRAISARRPDVIVSTYPGVTEVLGRLRVAGKLHAPVVSAITDLAGLRYWAHPGVDLHLLTHQESGEEVRLIAGDAPATWVRGLSSDEFLREQEPEAARSALRLARDGRLVLVSGGGWGMGDVEGAALVALARADVRVVCLCGTNARLYARLAERFSGEERVSVVEFTDRMSDYMAAADVLVHSTAGLTVTEAIMSGCRPISYGWGVGHIRVNNAAFRRFGLADVADNKEQLVLSLKRALDAPRRRDRAFADLPEAAGFVLELAGRNGVGVRGTDDP